MPEAFPPRFIHALLLEGGRLCAEEPAIAVLHPSENNVRLAVRRFLRVEKLIPGFVAMQLGPDTAMLLQATIEFPVHRCNQGTPGRRGSPDSGP